MVVGTSFGPGCRRKMAPMPMNCTSSAGSPNSRQGHGQDRHIEVEVDVLAAGGSAITWMARSGPPGACRPPGPPGPGHRGRSFFGWEKMFLLIFLTTFAADRKACSTRAQPPRCSLTSAGYARACAPWLRGSREWRLGAAGWGGELPAPPGPPSGPAFSIAARGVPSVPISAPRPRMTLSCSSSRILKLLKVKGGASNPTSR